MTDMQDACRPRHTVQHRPVIGMRCTLGCALPLLLVGRIAGAANGESPPRLAESPLSAANLVDTAGGLLLVVGVMLALAWLVKRYVQVPGIGKGQVQILGGVSLGAREKAVLLSVEGRRLLVGIAPGRVQTLLVLGEGDSTAPDFAEQLDGAARRAQGEAAT